MPLPKLTRLGNPSPSNHPERHLEIKVRRALQIPALIPDITEVLGETGMSSWCCQQSKEQMQDLRGCHHNPWDPSPGGASPPQARPYTRALGTGKTGVKAAARKLLML